MNSGLKGLTHTVLSIIGLYVPVVLAGSSWGTLTVAGIITALLNWGLSNTVPTTTGASAAQNAIFASTISSK